jgi:RHS repeat-associated protein
MDTPKRSTFLSDPSGTPLATVDATGSVTSITDHRPFGAAALGQTAPGQIGFKGSIEDSDAGFVYMTARFYDPDSGRFLSVDPVSPAPGAVFGFSPYGYANNNPISLSDPKGLYTCRIENHDECVAMVEQAKKYMKQAERQLSPGQKRTAMRGVLVAIGTNGSSGSKGENISFGFGNLGESVYGLTSYKQNSLNFTVTIDRAQRNARFGSDGYQYSVAVEQAATVVHEVQHVVNAVAGK